MIKQLVTIISFLLFAQVASSQEINLYPINYVNDYVKVLNQEQLNKAIKNSVDAILDVPGVLRISAGNFGGKLGDSTTNLLDILK